MEFGNFSVTFGNFVVNFGNFFARISWCRCLLLKVRKCLLGAGADLKCSMVLARCGSLRVPSQFRKPAGCRLLLYSLIRSLRARFGHISFGQGCLCEMALAAGDSRPSRCWISDSRPSKCSINAGLVAKRLKESSRFM